MPSLTYLGNKVSTTLCYSVHSAFTVWFLWISTQKRNTRENHGNGANHIVNVEFTVSVNSEMMIFVMCISVRRHAPGGQLAVRTVRCYCTNSLAACAVLMIMLTCLCVCFCWDDVKFHSFIKLVHLCVILLVLWLTERRHFHILSCSCLYDINYTLCIVVM